MDKIFVFPGQGAQSVGMGSLFVEEGNWAHNMWKEAESILGFSLMEKVFNGPEEVLKHTSVTQPAMYMTEVIIMTAALNAGLKPAAVAGHSLGEYAAVVASGSISWQDGLKLVKARGKIFSEISERKPGGMIAVIGLEENTLKEVLDSMDGVAEMANYNSPGQIVVSVSKDIFDYALEKIKGAGAKLVVPLKVSGGFHSSLLDDALPLMAEQFESVPFKDPSIEIYVNHSGDKALTAGEVKDALLKQINSPVQWVKTVANIVSEHEGIPFAEIGPGKVLQGLFKKIDGKIQISGVSSPEELQKLL